MRIVVIEPSRTVQRIITGVIEPWGHEVSSFNDAPEALAFLQTEHNVRALISSMELASISGIELVRSARKLTGQRPLYIMLMSSSGERSLMIQALDNGADDFMSKPPVMEELRARLRAADRITSMQAELLRLARTDPLSGLLNRRAFVEAAQEMLGRACSDHPLSLVICDLDHFKAINDSYGHDIGDLVLKKVSAALQSIAEDTGRLGGEEFAFLVEARADETIEISEDLRATVGELAINYGKEVIGVTCSIGVAELKPNETLDSLMRRADIALYEAKRLGRNRVISADTFPLTKEHQVWRGVTRVGMRRGE
jgi:two-component system cell cycle response regulator